MLGKRRELLMARKPKIGGLNPFPLLPRKLELQQEVLLNEHFFVFDTGNILNPSFTFTN